MPREGHSSVSLPDDYMDKLSTIMARHDCSSYAEALRLSIDTTVTKDFAEMTAKDHAEATLRKLEECGDDHDSG